MLEIKNLVKVYKTKGGQEVRALDDVSVKFPETGMVFLLGKSGSGKSTLLNVTGGLDKPDSGEIIIKGKNSKDFSGSDFDSYRNTFIGFIFQEYNILNEFNVEQNIELALQLQGKKNDKGEVEKLLEQVDLKEMAKRKPMTLSGGQKQRVAIARALIKNPEIIMADEPTGALDSNTGKQVFDTLKKLSETKLVIIVSHDRDFAEIYADRIIELADGKIISDTTKEHLEPKSLTDNINVINDNVVSIKNVEELKKDDMDKIYDLLKSQKGEVLISSNESNLKNIKQAIHINSDNKSEVFNDTKEVQVKEYNGKNTKFIKSHLPFGRAFKIGASSIKSKPVRMIFTVFLTLVALVMFGVASTLMLYDSNYSIMEALKNSDNETEVINKEYKANQVYYTYNLKTNELETGETRENYYKTYFTDSEINSLNSNNAGLNFAGIITFNVSGNCLSFNKVSSSGKYYSKYGLTGFVDAGEEFMNRSGFNLKAGKYPTNPDEIAISEYMYEVFKNNTSLNISSYEDLIYSAAKNNKYTANIYSNGASTSKDFKITAIYDVGMINSKFNTLKEQNPDMSPTDLEKLIFSYDSYMDNSYQLIGFVSKDFYEYYANILNPREESNAGYVNSVYARGIAIQRNPIEWEINENYGQGVLPAKVVNSLGDNISFYNFDDTKMTYKAPSNNEVYISYNEYKSMEQEKIQQKYNVIRNVLLENYKLDHDLYEILKENEVRTYYYDLLNNKGLSAGIAELDDLYNAHFANVYKNWYIYQLANSFVYSLPSGTDREDAIDSYNYLQNWVNGNMGESEFSWDIFNVNITHLSSLYQKAEYNNLFKRSMAKYYQDNYWKIGYTTDKELQEIFNDYYSDKYSYMDEDSKLDNLVMRLEEYGLDLSYNPVYVEPSTSISCYYKSMMGGSGELKVLGYFKTNNYYDNFYILSDEFISSNARVEQENIYFSVSETSYQKPEAKKYTGLITKTAFTQDQVNIMLKSEDTYRYVMTNNTYKLLANIIDTINTMKTVFLIVGLVFAVFAALMLFNFISSSISSKTREIGILRAVGARGSDLFKIFFSESGLLSIICVVLSVIISVVVCMIMNNLLAEKLQLKLLNFGVVNGLLIFGGAILLAFIGTFIPVLIASKKQPVDSIRTL